ncbi:MAG TPA: hypothetical protein PLG89_03065 [Arenimonas sp.]|nr:hypothetical protein [Arenimonas sp.]
MRRLMIVALVLFSLAAGAASAQQFSTLEERMTYAEFKAAGLEKLTPEELAALNSWLAGKSSGAVAATPAVDNRGFEGRTGAGGAVVSTVAGPFKGWKGKGDRITLANGQVWEVSDSGTRLSVSLENPTVTIERGMLDAWFLRVDGYNARARVKRIK